MELFQKGDATIDARKAILIEQRDQLQDRIADMQESLARLNDKISRYEQGLMVEEKASPDGSECPLIRRAICADQMILKRKDVFIMNLIENKTYDEERALYHLVDTTVKGYYLCRTGRRESVLKECRNIFVEDVTFSLRYPLARQNLFPHPLFHG